MSATHIIMKPKPASVNVKQTWGQVDVLFLDSMKAIERLE